MSGEGGAIMAQGCTTEETLVTGTCDDGQEGKVRESEKQSGKGRHT